MNAVTHETVTSGVAIEPAGDHPVPLNTQVVAPADPANPTPMHQVDDTHDRARNEPDPVAVAGVSQEVPLNSADWPTPPESRPAARQKVAEEHETADTKSSPVAAGPDQDDPL